MLRIIGEICICIGIVMYGMAALGRDSIEGLGLFMIAAAIFTRGDKG